MKSQLPAQAHLASRSLLTGEGELGVSMRSSQHIPNFHSYVSTWLRKDSARMGSSAASEMLLSRMKSRMKLVNQVALTILWHSMRNLPGTEMA